MKQQRKPILDPKKLGMELRERRKNLRKTLVEIAEITSVNVGQLSRIENGKMKWDGGNLQIFLSTLQNLEVANRSSTTLSVADRFAAIIKRSNRHAEAATAIVVALEQLM